MVSELIHNSVGLVWLQYKSTFNFPSSQLEVDDFDRDLAAVFDVQVEGRVPSHLFNDEVESKTAGEVDLLVVDDLLHSWIRKVLVDQDGMVDLQAQGH